MNNLKKVLASALLIFLGLGCKDKEVASPKNETVSSGKSTEVLLIGTFHYNNPGADVAKTKSFDILKEESQSELEFIATKVKKFNPSKIFVEWNHEEQAELDSLYGMYKKGTYFEQDSLSDFYLKNEIFQLAFRSAEKSGLNKLYGIDYRETQFPFDSVMTVVAENNQERIQLRISELIETFTSSFDDKISKGTSLVELTSYLNSSELREVSNEFHSKIPLSIGGTDNFIGPFLTSEWYKRNLYMWSLIEKNTDEEDERVMVLVGASHAAIFEQFMAERDKWNETRFEAILE